MVEKMEIFSLQIRFLVAAAHSLRLTMERWKKDRGPYCEENAFRAFEIANFLFSLANMAHLHAKLFNGCSLKVENIFRICWISILKIKVSKI